VENNEFAEWEEVYENRFYGTLKSEIQRLWAEGKHVVFDVDVLGGIHLKELYKNKALSVFVQAPSIEVLKARLLARATDDAAEIERRIEKAAFEMSFQSKFDVVIINSHLDKAIDEAFLKVMAFINENE
jgi:guanylate kinase